jgi:hypothetical protein
LLAVSGAVLAACGGGGEGSATPALRVDLIEPALDAVEETLGDSTTYFEVNATSLVVNVFVAVEGASVVQYIYDGEALVGPSTPVEASGVTFVRGIVDLNVPRANPPCSSSPVPVSPERPCGSSTAC